MNAKALLALIDECGMIELVNRSGRDIDGWIQETILRALRLLAAAEANDGNCPETEAAMCRYTGGEPVTFPKGLSAVVPYSFAANLERERNALAARVRELEEELVEQRDNKDGAYLERNRLVALLASMFPSGIKRTAIEGWSADWNGCVYIDFPWGQASWHYHDSHAFLFDHLPPYQGSWDGHTTEQKYAAIAARSK